MLAGIVTSILLLLFVGGWLWAWRPSHRKEFDAAARIPLEDDAEPRP